VKFSASNFFKDCTEYKCSVVLYIGQLCRYLLNTPPSSYDTKHNVKKACGNGLRKEIWKEFQTRFNIPYIGEFYGSTEGNATLINNMNKVGAVGYIPWIAKFFYPITVVKFDYVSEIPIRDKNGHCIECAVGEPGEMISKINQGDPMKSFDGYTDKKATDGKILIDVFGKGDMWFRSGDLLVADEEGFLFFVDRIGDTFRWKGENVATSEVSEVMAAFKGVKECNVYGVTVPNYDGRAGMASISIEEDSKLDLGGLYQHVRGHLAAYQQPLFLRIQKELVITSTFKHRKVEMVAEGFNPTTISDPLYFRDDRNQTGFVPLDPPLYEALIKNQIRL